MTEDKEIAIYLQRAAEYQARAAAHFRDKPRMAGVIIEAQRTAAHYYTLARRRMGIEQ